MTYARWIALALLAIVLIGSARLLWQQRAAAPRSSVQLALLLVLQLASTGLLYAVLVPPTVATHARRLTVLTHAAGDSRWTASEGESVVALPEAQADSTVERVPDLATALRQHPGTGHLHLVGDGLAARDRDDTLPAQVTLQAATPPRGWIALQPPPITAPGAVFAVHAQAQGVHNASAELLDPAGSVVDRAALAADGHVQLGGIARASGRGEFLLRLLDADRHAVDSLPVPVQTGDQRPTRVWIVAGAPAPELKYLRRWASDTGLTLHAQASAGGGVSLGDAPLTISAARLADTDVLVLDERSLATLSAAQRSAVQQALRDGLGVLVRSSGPLGESARRTLADWGLRVDGNGQRTPLQLPADPDAALLQARRGPARSPAQRTADIDAADSVSHAGALPTLERLALRPLQATALLRDAQQQPLGGWRDNGRGRVGLLPLTDSYRLVLAGRQDRHAELWSGVLSTLARPQPSTTAVRIGSLTPWAGERVALCGVVDDLQVRAADGTGVPLRIDPATGPARCAGYWPVQPGWHVLAQGTTTQAFYVFDPAAARAMHRQQTRDATTLRLGTNTAAMTSTMTPVPGARWPWFVAFVLNAGLLWWLERRRSRTPVA